MQTTVGLGWFLGICLASAGAGAMGVLLGRRSLRAASLTLAVGLVLIVGWAWLVRHPATAVQLIPVAVLSRVEGVAGVPFFMLLLGVAWSRCSVPRQRHVVAWGVMLGVVYFVNGGRWLLQETPSAVMGQTVEPYDIRQSQDYSCVPAACATALNLLGLPSTEMQMAELTQTRPGTGATLIRALDGLDRRLMGTGWRAVLLEPSVGELERLPLPALTPLQFEASRQHMVVVSRFAYDGVWVMDPMDGYTYFSREEFEAAYRRRVIVFERH